MLKVIKTSMNGKNSSEVNRSRIEIIINYNNGYFQMPILKSSKRLYKIMKKEGGQGNKTITQMFLSDST